MMTKSISKQISPDPAVDGGFLAGICRFFEVLEEMDRAEETTRKERGDFSGPFNSKTNYGCKVKLGIEAEDLPFKRRFRPGPKWKFKPPLIRLRR